MPNSRPEKQLQVGFSAFELRPRLTRFNTWASIGSYLLKRVSVRSFCCTTRRRSSPWPWGGASAWQQKRLKISQFNRPYFLERLYLKQSSMVDLSRLTFLFRDDCGMRRIMTAFSTFMCSTSFSVVHLKI